MPDLDIVDNRLQAFGEQQGHGRARIWGSVRYGPDLDGAARHAQSYPQPSRSRTVRTRRRQPGGARGVSASRLPKSQTCVPRARS